MDYTYKYKITTQYQFESWFIRTFIHNKVHMVLYALGKIIPIILVILGARDAISIGLLIILFLLGDIIIWRKHIAIERDIEKNYLEDNEVTVELRREAIASIYHKRTSTVLIGNINRIKKTKHFYFVMKDKQIYKTFFIKHETEENKQILEDYFRLQLERYPRLKAEGFKEKTDGTNS